MKNTITIAVGHCPIASAATTPRLMSVCEMTWRRSVRHLCTHAAKLPRTLAIRTERTFTALQTARQRQQTPAFKGVYAKRAGIEGTLSQGVRAFGLRRSRYVGEAKTRLQHFMIASALNIVRLFAWNEDRPQETTRRSRFAALAPAAGE